MRATPRVTPLLLLGAALLAMGCGDDEAAVPTADVIVRPPGSLCARVTNVVCHLATPANDCWGVSVDSTCDGGGHRCPDGMIIASQCRSLGCSPAPDTLCVQGLPGAACDPRPIAPTCAPSATSWTCPEGSIPFTDCACFGEPGTPCEE